MYTYEQWKEVKAALNLTNKKIAEIIGKTEGNVKKQLSPNAKKLPTWANAMIYAYIEGLEKAIQANREAFLIGDIKSTIHCAGAVKWPDGFEGNLSAGVTVPKWDDVKRAQEFDASLLAPHPLKKCDCHIDADGIFRRGKIKCNLSKDQHNF